MTELSSLMRGLVNQRFGVIKFLSEAAETLELPHVHVASSLLTPGEYFRDNEPHQSTSGLQASGAGLSRSAALWATVGESIERYAAQIYDSADFLRTSAERLGERAAPLGDFVPFKPAQHRIKGFRYARPTADAVLQWCPGVRLRDGAPVWLPAHAVYLGLSTRPGEPAFWPTMSTGLACGPNFDAALLSGVREIIERDAFSTMWLLRWSPPRLTLDAAFLDQVDWRLQALLREQYPLRFHLWFLPTDLGAPVVMAAVQGQEGEITFGACAGLSLLGASEKALIEACHTWIWSRRFVDDAKKLKQHPLDARDVVNADSRLHVSYYLRSINSVNLDFLLSGQSAEAASNVNQRLMPISAERLFESVYATGREIYFVDVTPADVAAAGLSVVRALISRTQQFFFGHAIRNAPLGAMRLAEAASYLGIKERRRVNRYPHPFP